MAETDSVAAVINDLYEEDMGGAAAEETPSDQTEPVVEAEAQRPPEPDPEDRIPQDIQDLLAEPDFEAEAEAEVAALATQQDEDQTEYDEYDDPIAAERKARIKAERRAEWLEAKRVEENKGKWEAEALKYFPHAKPFIGKIDATSRRAFLKQASAYHESIAAHVASVAPGNTGELAKLREELEQIKTQNAWGPPMASPAGAVPGEAADAQKRWETASARKDLLGMVKARSPEKLLGL